MSPLYRGNNESHDVSGSIERRWNIQDSARFLKARRDVSEQVAVTGVGFILAPLVRYLIEDLVPNLPPFDTKSALLAGGLMAIVGGISARGASKKMKQSMEEYKKL